MNKAWHLRRDGTSFSIPVHIYCMGDEDLSSEAEVSAFIIDTNTKEGYDFAEYVLDAWMALLIEEKVSYDTVDNEAIHKIILEELNHLPYKFSYPLTRNELLSIHDKLDNYRDVDTLYEFIDSIKSNISNIQEKIKKIFNGQFCRVRYGGQYNSTVGNNEIWFRVSSVGYNWSNTIYKFVCSLFSSIKIDKISICRDAESDDSEVEYFYKAKDGASYEHMPINEYLEEEHEHNPYFENIDINSGVLHTVSKLLETKTYPTAYEEVQKLEPDISKYRNLYEYLLRKERSKCVASPILSRRNEEV